MTEAVTGDEHELVAAKLSVGLFWWWSREMFLRLHVCCYFVQLDKSMGGHLLRVNET